MQLSKKQKEIIETKNTKVIVNCAAASGKTRCLTYRLQYLIDNNFEGKIVAITFTNAAAEEMRQRLSKIPDNIFIGTIHSYCNYLLLINGISTKEIIEKEDFDSLFKLYRENNLKEEVDYLLLDEAQDSTKNEFFFLFHNLNPKNWMVFADRRQSIYGFREACPEYLDSLSCCNDVVSISLNENYRNGRHILNYASGLMLNEKLPYGYRDDSICMSGREGQVSKIELNYDSLAQLIKSYDEYRDWFVLCRTNAQLDTMKSELEARGLPCTTFRQADLSSAGLSEAMNENTVKVLTIHSSKGLEAKNVAVYGMKFWNKEEICCSYVAATRAQERLYVLSAPKKRRTTKVKTNIVNWE